MLRKKWNLCESINDVIKNAIHVDEGFDLDLNKEHQKAIEEHHAAGSFQKLFWEEQVKARSKQDSWLMQWHPMMVRW